LPAWRKWMPRGQALTGTSAGRTASITAILRQRSFWGASAGHFSVTYLLYLTLTWLPLYLVRERHLSMNAMAKTAAVYFLFDAGAGVAIGWLSDSFIRRGYAPTRVRKSVMAVGHATAAHGNTGLCHSRSAHLSGVLAIICHQNCKSFDRCSLPLGYG